jgi:hypothetical protein
MKEGEKNSFEELKFREERIIISHKEIKTRIFEMLKMLHKNGKNFVRTKEITNIHRGLF